MHHRLVRLVLEIRLVSIDKVRGRPLLELIELLLRRTDLDSSLDAVRRQRPSPLDIPLLVHLLLHLRIAPDEVVKGVDIRLRPVRRESQVMVLEVLADAGQVHGRLDASTAQLLGVTDSRALQDKRRGEGAAADDDLLSGAEDAALRFFAVEGLGWDGGDADSAAVLDDDPVDLGVALQVQVGVSGTRAVDVRVGGVASASCGVLVRVQPRPEQLTSVAVDPLQPVLRAVSTPSAFSIQGENIRRLQILEIVRRRNPLALRCPQKVLRNGIRMVAKGDLDGPVKAVQIRIVAGPLVRLVLLHQRDQLVGCPAFGLEVIVVGR